MISLNLYSWPFQMARVQIMLHLFLRTSEEKDFIISGLNAPYELSDFPYTSPNSSFLLMLPISSIKWVHRTQLITAMFMTIFHVPLLCLFSV